MVQVNKDQITRNGVALSDLTIDELRFFESETTEQIIIHTDELSRAKEKNLKTLIPFLENTILRDEQGLDFIQAEIKNKYNSMVV